MNNFKLFKGINKFVDLTLIWFIHKILNELIAQIVSKLFGLMLNIFLVRVPGVQQ